MIHTNVIRYLFESDEVTGYLTLRKTEVDDKQFVQMLGIKPSEINIILARVSSFIKNDDPQKSKKDLINDILEVLERSSVARQFVGIGVQQEYHLFKGFPVRAGDPYEHMPEAGQELVLHPSEVYIGWTSDNAKAREDAVKYDASKGEPIGGLLIDVHVDVTKILFDINAVIQTVKAKYPLIQQYNQAAAPGKSLSKSNTTFLANDAPLYKGQWEIISTNKVINARVVDKWIWDNSSSQKTIKWVSSDKVPVQDETPEEQPEASPEPNAVQSQAGPELEPETPATQAPAPPVNQMRERMMRMFEQADIAMPDSGVQQQPVPVYEDIIDEALWQGVKNFLSKSFGTIRGKKLKYLQSLAKFYEAEKQIYALARDFASNIDKDPTRVKYAEQKLQKIEGNIEKIKNILRDVESGLNLDDIPDVKQDSQQPEGDTGEPSEEDNAIDKSHDEMKQLAGNDELEDVLAPNKQAKE